MERGESWSGDDGAGKLLQKTVQLQHHCSDNHYLSPSNKAVSLVWLPGTPPLAVKRAATRVATNAALFQRCRQAYFIVSWPA